MKIECMLKAAGLIAITYYVIKSIDKKKQTSLPPRRSDVEHEVQIGSRQYMSNPYRSGQLHHTA